MAEPEAGEERACRICRSGPEPHSPLFHPCRCSGSIQHVHAECLMEWLEHSKKRHCELCSTPYRFRKRYAAGMPAVLPASLYVRQGAVRLAALVCTAARAALVAVAWLALLPLGNIYSYNGLLCIGELLVALLTGSEVGEAGLGAPPPPPPPAGSEATMCASDARATAAAGVLSSVVHSSLRNLTSANGTERQALVEILTTPDLARQLNVTRSDARGLARALRMGLPKQGLVWLGYGWRLPDWAELSRTLARHIFEGQVLTCALVVVFVAVFLFREWVLQNMPQPLDELGGEDAAAGAPLREAARGADEAPEAAEPAAPGAPQDLPSPLLRAAARMDDADLTNFVARVQQLSAQLEAPRAGPEQDAGTNADEPARQPHGELALISALAEDEIDLAALRAARLDRFAPRDIRPLPTRRTPTYQAALDLLDERHSEVGAAASDAESTPELPSSEVAEAESSRYTEQPGETLLAVTADKGKGRALDEPDDRAASLDSSHTEVSAGGLAPSGSTSAPALPAFAELDISESRELDPDVTVDPRFSPKGASDFVALNEDGQGERWGAASTSSPRLAHGRAKRDDWPAPVDSDDAGHQVSSSAAAAGAAAQARTDEGPAAARDDAPAQLAADARLHALHEADEEVEEPEGEQDGDEPGPFDIEVWEEDEEDLEGPVGGAPLEEDLEGMMEAIGMRGPLSGLAANVSLMYVLCNFVMLVFVALPFVIGKLFGAGSRLPALLLLPIKVVRLATDPLFDFIIACAHVAVRSALQLVSGVVPTARLAELARPSSGQLSSLAQKLAALSAQPSAASAEFSPHTAALLGHQLLDSVRAWHHALDAHTRGQSLSSQALCVGLGWTYFTLLVMAQSQLLGDAFFERIHAKWLKTAIDQQLTLLKVILFTVVELLCFPMACGVLLDLCTMPLWAGLTPAVRWAQLCRAPFSTAFTIHVCGTLWMYLFAQFVSQVRASVRPGVMCWIRDSNELDFHPIREILERRSWLQVRKIMLSAVLYASVLVPTVGASVFAAKRLGVLPLVWKPHEALSEHPFDLVAVLYVLKPTIRAVAPENLLAVAGNQFFTRAARLLRLSAYLVGTSAADEQAADGSYARVPNQDSVPPGRPLITRTDAAGTPLHAAPAAQPHTEDEAKVDGKYIVVWLPPLFKARVAALVALLWLAICASTVCALALPLTLGRSALRLLFTAPLHDFYPFCLGLSLLLGAAAALASAHKAYRRVQRAPNVRRRLRRTMLVRLRLRGLKLLRRLWIVFAFGAVTPLLLGLAVESYLIAPFRPGASTAAAPPAMSLASLLALGLLEQRFAVVLMLRLARNDVPGQGFIAALTALHHNGIARPRAVRATLQVFLPVAGLLGCLLLAPLVIVLCLSLARPVDGPRCLVDVQRALLCSIATAALLLRGYRHAQGWSTAIRDTYFLKELELRDYDEQAKGDDAVQDPPAQVPAEAPAPDAQRPVESPAPAADGLQAQQPRTPDEASSADNWSGALPSEPLTAASSFDVGTASAEQSLDASSALDAGDEAPGSPSYSPKREPVALAGYTSPFPS